MKTRVTESTNRKFNEQHNFIKSAGYAIQGILMFFKSERNGKIQAVIAVVVVIAGMLFSISIIEWLVIILFIALVLSLEMLNSALEKLCDKVIPEIDPQIKVIKDVAAGAVLWTSVLSVIAAICIFIPKIITLL